MKPTRADVEQMVAALFTVTAGLERARRKKKDAARLSVLQVVAWGGRVRPSDVAAALDVHPSQITRQVKALEEAGHVHVEADPDDRRSCFVSLTPDGTAEVARLGEVGMSRFTTFVGDWDAADVREFTRLLAKFEASKAAVGEEEERAARRARPGWRERGEGA
ncbi:MAG TPA: MarR family winged helix-turn-helix transcriptional regulator [Streptosporangiaceae bacterium]|jgi:DNA-binding MarR family transcriptional regulator